MTATILALLAGLSFALGSALQQRGALQTAAPEGDPRFLGQIIRKPAWLLGGVFQSGGWVLQAAALNYGSLALVQALVSLSLVFALPLGALLSGQHVGKRSITGAGVTLLGITLFVAVGQPQGGGSQPGARDWITTGLSVIALMILLAWSAHQRRGAMSAVLFASAAGLAYAFQAAVTKVFVTQLGEGAAAILSSWTTYGLIFSALAGFAMQQSALKTGFLAPAMAASNAAMLVMSVLLSVTLFNESISNGSERVLPALVGLALAVSGVLMLAVPETEQRVDPIG